MRTQRGITLTGFLVFAVIGIVLLLLGFKIGPAYAEFYTIQKTFRAMAADSTLQNATRSEINVAYNARSGMDNIKAVSAQDLIIEKDASGLVISAAYSVRVPLVKNLSACMEFNPTSAK